jgi:hypothetical protein
LDSLAHQVLLDIKVQAVLLARLDPQERRVPLVQLDVPA